MAPFYTMVFTIQVANFGLLSSLNILILVCITSLPWQFRYFPPPTPQSSHLFFCYVSEIDTLYITSVYSNFEANNLNKLLTFSIHL